MLPRLDQDIPVRGEQWFGTLQCPVLPRVCSGRLDGKAGGSWQEVGIL